jgi:hypothetical protein
VDDPKPVRPLLISEEALAFRRWVERFGSATPKLGHLPHAGTVRSSIGDDRIRIIELVCDCGALLGPWRDL